MDAHLNLLYLVQSTPEEKRISYSNHRITEHTRNETHRIKSRATPNPQRSLLSGAVIARHWAWLHYNGRLTSTKSTEIVRVRSYIPVGIGCDRLTAFTYMRRQTLISNICRLYLSLSLSGYLSVRHLYGTFDSLLAEFNFLR
jgi:hypothetical protein